MNIMLSRYEEAFTVVVKHVQFVSSMCHNENVIGEEGNGKRSAEFHFYRKNSRALSLVSGTLEIEYATQLVYFQPTRRNVVI